VAGIGPSADAAGMPTPETGSKNTYAARPVVASLGIGRPTAWQPGATLFVVVIPANSCAVTRHNRPTGDGCPFLGRMDAPA
jgi:hypothetical protein